MGGKPERRQACRQSRNEPMVGGDARRASVEIG